jgi:catechol 2,3-dioxygenase-like lactoylglutathione lyase family enzyme
MSVTTDEHILNADTSMGAVTLRVGSLETMSDYYSGAFAMAPLEEKSRGHEVHRVLGRGTTPLVRLISTPDLPAVDPRQAGLFHTAFLFETPQALAATVYRAAQDPRSRFIGSSDHLVSEAFYFTDPEGNGVELYTDRDRDTWIHDGEEIRMATEYLDRLPAESPRPAHPGCRPVRRRGRRPRPPSGRRHPDRQGVLRRRTRLRSDPGPLPRRPVRLGRRLPPPHRHEHLEQSGLRPARGQPRPR